MLMKGAPNSVSRRMLNFDVQKAPVQTYTRQQLSENANKYYKVGTEVAIEPFSAVALDANGLAIQADGVNHAAIGIANRVTPSEIEICVSGIVKTTITTFAPLSNVYLSTSAPLYLSTTPPALASGAIVQVVGSHTTNGEIIISPSDPEIIE